MFSCLVGYTTYSGIAFILKKDYDYVNIGYVLDAASSLAKVA